KQQLPEAISDFRRTIDLDPRDWEAHRELKDVLIRLDQLEEARTAWQYTVSLQPPEHGFWDGYAELCLYLHREQDYRDACKALLNHFGNTTDPAVAERTGRACLLLPVSGNDLQSASRLVDVALSTDPNFYAVFQPYFRFAKGLAEYRAD